MRQTLLVFIAISIAAHAAVLVFVSPFERGTVPATSAELKVVILQPEPLPAAHVEPPAPVPPSRARAPAATLSSVTTVAGSRQPAPVATLPLSVPVAAGTVPVAPAGPEPQPPRSQDQPATAGAPAIALLASAAYLRTPAPLYPPAALRAGEQGTVTLRVLVTREGLAARVDIEKSSGSPHLDAAALETVKAWRFVPAPVWR